MQSNVLMFSIAQNGYDFLYSKCIKSQQLYASHNSYEYVIVNRPRWVSSRRDESAWLKIPLILEGLGKGYEWFFFVDADCEIRPQTPRIESLEMPNKSLYLAPGHSGRVKSGVIIVKNADDATAFFQKVLSTAEMPIPQEDSVGWGENGHVIHYLKKRELLHIIDRRWNNNTDVTLDDYIRHYTGPMRKHYEQPVFSKTNVRILKLTSKIINKLAKVSGVYSEPQKSLKSRLQELTQFCQNEFPAFKTTVKN